jgi:hypothetical protein
MWIFTHELSINVFLSNFIIYFIHSATVVVSVEGDWLIDHVDGGETTSLRRGHQQAYFSSPRWYMIMENHGEMMMSAVGNCWIVYQSSLAILPWEPSGSVRRNGRQKWGFCLARISFAFESDFFLRAVKSHDMVLPALLPLRRKLCCGFLSPLKIHRLGWVWIRDPWVQWQAH